MNQVKSSSTLERLTALVVAGLLILTALGNAWLLLAGAMVGLAVGLWVFRKSISRSTAGTTLLAAVIAVVIAMLLSFR